MRIGYAHVSANDQHFDRLRDARAKAGCERFLEDTATGTKAKRTGLIALLATLRIGDTAAI